MKILQVTNFFKPSWEAGGPPRVAYEISKKLVEKGHEVTVYTTDGFKWRLDVEKNKPVYVDGIRTYYFRNLSSYLTKRVFPIPYYAPLVTKKEIMNFDVIHVHEGNVLGTIISYYAKKYKVPYILQAHGFLASKLEGKRSLKGKMWDILFEYRTLYGAKKVLALTETEAKDYKKMGINENKIEIIPNGIDLEQYKHLPKKGRFRKKYGLKDREKIILYLGRINRTKGIDLLANAFANLSKKLDNIRLVLVGPDDGYRSELEKLIEALKINDKVLFTGFVSNEEKLAALVDADVFVTPSFSGFPVTFLEACACGVPIITTTNGDKLDWIHNKVGYVVEYNREKLANAIYNVIYDKELRMRLGKNGRKLAREEFDWSKIIQKLEKIYLRIIQDTNQIKKITKREGAFI